MGDEGCWIGAGFEVGVRCCGESGAHAEPRGDQHTRHQRAVYPHHHAEVARRRVPVVEGAEEGGGAAVVGRGAAGEACGARVDGDPGQPEALRGSDKAGDAADGGVTGFGSVIVDGTAADLASGQPVRVQRTMTRGGVVTGTVAFLRNKGDAKVELIVAPSAVVRTEGLVYDLDTAAGTFKANGTPVGYGAGTTFDDSSSSALQNGALVEVQGTLNGTSLAASRIEIKSIDSLTLAEARGQVAEFASLASFPVAGKLVDAGTAVLLRGSAARRASRPGHSPERAGRVAGRGPRSFSWWIDVYVNVKIA